MTINNPLVSVIIPAYNHERFVEQTIRSIIEQTYKNIELIVIDDGSKDSTFSILKSMEERCQKRFANVHFETQSNQGTCITLNRLIAQAQGKYIYIIASDDVAKPQAIQSLYDALKDKPQFVLAFCDNEFINSDSVVINWDDKQNSIPQGAGYATFWNYLIHKKKTIPSNPDEYGSYASLLRGNYIPNGYLISASALRQIPKFTTEAPLEDWYMHLQLSKIGKYAFIPQVLFSYRWHSNNTIKQSEKMRKITLMTLEYEKKLVEQKGYERWKELFFNVIFRKKSIISWGRFLRLYKEYQIASKQTILEICGHKIVIKYKKY